MKRKTVPITHLMLGLYTDYKRVSQVICDSSKGCKEEYNCGGVKPHDFDLNECNKCPINKNQKCISVKEKHK